MTDFYNLFVTTLIPTNVITWTQLEKLNKEFPFIYASASDEGRRDLKNRMKLLGYIYDPLLKTWNIPQSELNRLYSTIPSYIIKTKKNISVNVNDNDVTKPINKKKIPRHGIIFTDNLDL